jgi:hypothetical protein
VLGEHSGLLVLKLHLGVNLGSLVRIASIGAEEANELLLVAATSRS